MGRDLPSILRQTRSYHCLNCGKCTAACPLPEVKAGYSPRRIVARSVLGSDGSGEGAWSCLTCGACRSVCPMDVDYTGFVRQVRQEGLERGEGIPSPHAGIFQCVPRMHASSDRTQDRMAWITPDLEVATRGEIVLFVGCLPYYDEVFSWLGIASTDIARSAVRILNRLGIRPAILPAERCCGHDAYWNGETETFRRLAERNIETLRSAGAKTVLATCPECFLSLSKLYPSVGKLPFEVRHFYDFLLEHRDRLAFGPGGAAVTFHDPCRLAKHLGIHDTPRDLLAMAGADLREMPRSRERSVCCGTSGWSNCGLAAKTLQRGRLEEAVASGARTLVTACPKCRIHLSCANHDEKRDLRIVDLVEFLANGRKT